jgi:CHASE2 domain-containing sensor protein
VKTFAPCFAFAVLAETLIYRGATREYSPWVLALLTAVWGLGSLAIAWFEPRLRFVYFGSVVLAAPSISYSMLGYGLLEMAGFIHAICAGAYAIPAYFLMQRFKVRNPISSEPH